MIVYDLRCGDGHVFEAWFASSLAYDEQRAADQIACPFCGVVDVDKAMMAPAISAKGNRRDVPPPASVKHALKLLAERQAKVLASSEWVGGEFASRARAMHAGDEPDAPIHGQASVAEAKALVEEGVPITPLPVPVIPPQSRH